MNGSQPMIQVLYGDGALCVRKAVTGSEAADIRGDYNTYDTQDTLTVDGLDDKAMTAPSPDFPTSLLPGGSILSPFRCLLAAFAALAEALPAPPGAAKPPRRGLPRTGGGAFLPALHPGGHRLYCLSERAGGDHLHRPG